MINNGEKRVKITCKYAADAGMSKLLEFANTLAQELSSLSGDAFITIGEMIWRKDSEDSKTEYTGEVDTSNSISVAVNVVPEDHQKTLKLIESFTKEKALTYQIKFDDVLIESREIRESRFKIDLD